MELECAICFSSVSIQLIHSCSDERCTESFCRECLTLLIEFSADEKTIPKCPIRECNSYILLFNITGVENKTVKLYEESCLEFFLKEQGDDVKRLLQEKSILVKLREERQKFINKQYPAAIALTAQIAFTSRLRKLEKQKSKLIQKQLASSKRACMNSTCSGFLDDNLQCMLCQSSFCIKCEVLLKPKHECKQEDLEAISMVNGMIKCPGCSLPVFKNVGCNHMKCSVCNTCFDYETGKENGSEHGGENMKIQVNLKQRHNLSRDYKHKLNALMMNKIVEIESREPKVTSKDTLLTPLKLYFDKTSTKEICAKKLAKAINHYHIQRFRIRDYQVRLVQIENALKQSKTSNDELYKLLNDCLAWLNNM